MIIGVTGKSGSGKSTFIQKFLELDSNIKYINFDQISHDCLEIPIIKSWLRDYLHLPENYTTKDIGKLIFNNKELNKELSQLVWKHMQIRIDELFERNNGKHSIFLDYLLLPQTKYWDMCDLKILMKRDDEKRFEDASKRDLITREYWDLRETNSIEFIESDFDYIVNISE